MNNCKVSKCIFKWNDNHEYRNIRVDWSKVYWLILDEEKYCSFGIIPVYRINGNFMILCNVYFVNDCLFGRFPYLDKCMNNCVKLFVSSCFGYVLNIDFSRIDKLVENSFISLWNGGNFKLIRSIVRWFGVDRFVRDIYYVMGLNNRWVMKYFLYVVDLGWEYFMYDDVQLYAGELEYIVMDDRYKTFKFLYSDLGVVGLECLGYVCKSVCDNFSIVKYVWKVCFGESILFYKSNLRLSGKMSFDKMEWFFGEVVGVKVK